MKTEEDEAFDELAKKQGMWGGGFQAKRAAAADKLQDGKCKCVCHDGCAACRQMAQPAQEPNYWLGYGLQAHAKKPFENATALYTALPKRPWVELTGFEQKELMAMTPREAVFATEAKLKEKNNG